MKFKFVCILVDTKLTTAGKKDGKIYSLIQFQVLLNQMITNGTYIKHRTVALPDGMLYHEILAKPTEGE